LKTNRFWLGLSLVGLLASCNFTEEIYLNENGSGSITLNFDGSELMSMTGDSLAMEEAAMDSVIYFSDLLREKKDSIATLPAEEQERLRLLEPYRMHMKSDPASGEMFFNLSRDFNDIGEVEDAFNAFQSTGVLDDREAGKPESPKFGESTSVSYRFDSRTFSRHSVITDQVLHQQRLDSLESASMFLGGSTYTLKVHFPRRVRSSSAQEATLSMDGKTLIREVDFLEYLRNPAVLDLEVELED